MTRVDFYILPGTDGVSGPVTAACRLCDKAAAAGKRIYLRPADAAESEALDGALWSFRQGGFLAHELFDGRPIGDPQPAILIGQAEPPDSHHDVLVNLGAEVPDYFSRFERVLEIVGAEDHQRAASRQRYKFYRDRGYALNTFEQADDGSWKRRSG